MEISIPKGHREAFGLLAMIPQESFNAITESLGHALPVIGFPELQQILQDAIKAVLPDADTEQLASAVVAFAVTATQRDFEAGIVPSVVTSVATNLKLHSSQQSALHDRLAVLLKLPAIAISAKSTLLQVAHARVFTDCKIVTDLRPIFVTDPPSNDWAFMVIHHLQLSCVHHRDREDLYIAMADSDLVALQDAIARARSKSGLLRATLKAKDVAEITGAAT